MLDMIGLDPQVASAIRDRVQLIREWRAEQAARCVGDLRDLALSTPERAYWHFGYQAALQDILDYVDPIASAITHTRIDSERK